MSETLKVCRYLEPNNYCAYWDMELRGDEDIKCYPGGWECYEEPGGAIYEGGWLTIVPVYNISSGERWTCEFQPRLITYTHMRNLVGFDGDVVDYYKKNVQLPDTINIPEGVTFQVISEYFDREREKLYGSDNGA